MVVEGYSIPHSSTKGIFRASGVISIVIISSVKEIRYNNALCKGAFWVILCMVMIGYWPRAPSFLP